MQCRQKPIGFNFHDGQLHVVPINTACGHATSLIYVDVGDGRIQRLNQAQDVTSMRGGV